MREKISHKISYAFVTLVLILSLVMTDVFCGVFTGAVPVNAAGLKLSLNTAINLAITNSDSLEDLDIQIMQKKSELSSAVKSIAIRRKKMASFTWSPLFSFKFPTDPTAQEEYEFSYKPLSIQSEINKLYREVIGEKISITADIYESFVEVYTLQEQISFNRDRLTIREKQYSRVKSQLFKGQATEDDVELVKAAVDALRESISADETAIIESKKKISKKIDLDVTTNYYFADPYVSTDLPREMLEELIQYTLDNDSAYYAQCETASSAKTALQVYYQIFNRNYKSKDMNIIRPFISTALRDEDINKKAFDKSYKEFLKAIDSYWEGRYHVFWFIYIPRIWLKDEEEDGTGYISDDPEALKSKTLDYVEKRKARDNYKDTLTEQVRDTYNNYVSLRKAYNKSSEDVKRLGEDLRKAEIKNKLGKMTFAEYQDLADSYEEAQLEKIKALADYSSNLYEFNKLTCGKVMEYLLSTGIGTKAADGSPYLEQDIDKSTAYYFIEPIVQNSEFEMHIYIPDDFSLQVTHYELWVGNKRIGDKRTISTGLRHEQLDLNGDEVVKVRLYNGNSFIDDCIIDPRAFSGPLEIIVDSTIVGEARTIAYFNYSIDVNTDMVAIGFAPVKGVLDDAKYIKIKNQDGKYLISDTARDIDNVFRYLSFIAEDFDKLTVEFYTEDETYITEGIFKTDTLEIKESVTDSNQ